MNHVNSILLEGEVTETPILRRDGVNGHPSAVVTIKSKRTYGNGEGTRVEETLICDCHTHGKLAEVCAEHVKAGREVRVVGRLKSFLNVEGDATPQRALGILAEQIEFAPTKRQRKPQAVAS